MAATKPMAEYNIVFFGETGVGKSTTINSFANFLKNANFEEALSSDLLEVIPTKIKLPNPSTGNLVVIESADKDGGTQVDKLPSAYSLEIYDSLVRLIDTPGIGENAELNKQNFDKIFHYLSSLAELHAICFVIKSTMTEITPAFRSFTTQLLSRLHKNVLPNFVFCFTYSRVSYYKQGECFATLKNFFSDELKVPIELNSEENCCFIDNESYRFLAAREHGFPLDKSQESMCKESWEESAEQAEDMILNIFDFVPHHVAETVALNENLKWYTSLNEQMPKLQENIHSSKQSIDNEEKRLAGLIQSKDAMVEAEEISKCEATIELTKKSIERMKAEVGELQEELKVLKDVHSKAAHFLMSNCIKIPKQVVDSKIGKKFTKLGKALQVMTLDDDIDKLGQKLFQLERIGPQLRQLMNSTTVEGDQGPIIEEIDDSDSDDSSGDEHQLMPKEKVIFKMNKSITSKPPPKVPEFNILLLGETGAGKSTTINAFANYLKYSTFEEATENDFVEMIPSKFTLPHPVSGEPFEIVSGNDKNELQGDGNSSTQDPVCYQFRFGGGLIRLIDTPGMGDTTGVDADKLNFDKILAHLNHYDTLHGICILMKSTETRKTASFRYCINELLTHLHKSACQNIVFCFTFSRNSFYGPGEGFSTLRGFLQKELKEVNLNLKSGGNCFYIDNEAYRFLVAKKQNYPFKPKQELSYKESWETSVQQTEYMMDRIMKSSPHKLNETCSLNNARKLILEMAEPMVQLQANINANIAHIKAEEQRIKNSNQTIQDLARNLNLQVDDVEMKELPYPATVCTTNKCTEVINFQGQQKIDYKTRCHPHCYLSGVTVNTIGHPILRSCAAMAGQTNCQVCGCPWDVHMHQTCETVKVKRTIIDSNKQKEIKNVEDAKAAIDSGILTMRQLVADFEEEFKVILDVSSKFAYILIDNSNTPYNRFIEPYLNLLIDEEQKKMNAIDNYPRTAYDSLVKMKQTHRENVRILSEAIKNKSQEQVRIEDIKKFRDELFNLKHSGPQFKQMLSVTQSANQHMFRHMERPPVDFTKKSGPFAQAASNFKKQCRRNGSWKPLQWDDSSQWKVVEAMKKNKKNKKK